MNASVIPFGGKPDSVAFTSYAEFGLTFTDRNDRDMHYVLQYL